MQTRTETTAIVIRMAVCCIYEVGQHGAAKSCAKDYDQDQATQYGGTDQDDGENGQRPLFVLFPGKAKISPMGANALAHASNLLIVKGCRSAVPVGEELPGHLFTAAADEDMFFPALQAGFDGDGRFRQVQPLGQKSDHGFVGPTFDRWGGQPQFQGIVMQSGQFVPA